MVCQAQQHPGPQHPAGPTPTQETTPEAPGPQAAQQHIDLRAPSTPPEETSCTADHTPTAAPDDTPLTVDPKDESPHTAQPTAPPLAPALSSINALPDATKLERNRIDRTYGLDCTIRTRQSLGQGHRIHHP